MERFQGCSLSRVFRQVAKLHHHHLHRMLSDKDVYPGQPPLLTLLAEQDGLSQKELAGHMQNRPATVTVMLDRMEKTGLVERRTDPADQRVSRVYLTEKGKLAHKETRQVLVMFQAALFDGFTDEEMAAMRAYLLRMTDNLHKLDPEEAADAEPDSSPPHNPKKE